MKHSNFNRPAGTTKNKRVGMSYWIAVKDTMQQAATPTHELVIIDPKNEIYGFVRKEKQHEA